MRAQGNDMPTVKLISESVIGDLRSLLRILEELIERVGSCARSDDQHRDETIPEAKQDRSGIEAMSSASAVDPARPTATIDRNTGDHHGNSETFSPTR